MDRVRPRDGTSVGTDVDRSAFAAAPATLPAPWLPALITRLGSLDFGGALAQSLATGFGVGHVCVFVFEPGGSVTTLLTEGGMGDAMAGRLARDYGGGWFRNDPHLEGVLAAGSELRRLQLRGGQAYTREYSRRFFDSVGVTRKAAYAARIAEGGRIYANFHRLGSAACNFDELDPWAATLGALLERHRALRAGACRHEREDALAVLPRREREVCEGILRGLTSEGIALALGISRNTVLTLRRRAYERLGVHSQSQLMRLALARH